MDVIYWRHPVISFGCFCVWQLWCSHLDFTLAISALIPLALLVHSYIESRRKPLIHLPPSAWQLWRTLLPCFAAQVRGITVLPPNKRLTPTLSERSPHSPLIQNKGTVSPHSPCDRPSRHHDVEPTPSTSMAHASLSSEHGVSATDGSSWLYVSHQLDTHTRASIDAGARTASVWAVPEPNCSRLPTRCVRLQWSLTLARAHCDSRRCHGIRIGA